MAAGPAAAAEWVVNKLPRDHPPTDPEALIVSIGESEGWFASPAEAQERAELWRKRFLNRLRLVKNDPQSEGRPVRFDFNTSDAEMIQGVCFVESSDSDDLKASKGDRLHVDEYVAFIRSLTGRQFEGVCRGLLALMGCSEPTLTPRGNDQGIDFFGKLKMEGRLDKLYVQTSVDRAMNVWILGQAKQIEGKVQTSEIRDLLGAVQIARLGISADEGKALAELGMKPLESHWRFFVTTGEFSRDALKLVHRLGLVGMDGDMVATVLADHRIADLNAVCDRGTFDAWVASHLPPGES